MPVEVKICGLARQDDALMAAELGADYLGFIFYKESPRCIAPEQVSKIAAQLPSSVRAVGVFVNTPPDQVLQIVNECRLAVVQFHGSEDLRTVPPMPVTVWKAVRISAGSVDLPQDATIAERVVLDTAVAGLYGGTGRQIDLQTAAAIAAKHRVMLGGGLTPDNVAEAVRTVCPIGVDVSSGVESAPGVKDHRKLRAFIAAAKSAA